MGYTNLLGIPHRGLGPVSAAQNEPVWVSAPFQAASGTPTGALKLPTFSQSHAIYNPNTGVITALKEGSLTVSAGVEITGVFTSGQFIGLGMAQAGSKTDSAYSHVSMETNITKTNVVQLTHTFFCRIGDTITVSTSSNGSSLSYTTNLSGSHLSVIA